jgi:aminoglycoside 6-adenylyltransferase
MVVTTIAWSPSFRSGVFKLSRKQHVEEAVGAFLNGRQSPVQYNQLMDSANEGSVLKRLIDWASTLDLVRVMILTSSRANQQVATDCLSDYDVVLCVSDPSELLKDDSWITHLGEILVRFPNPEQPGYRENPVRLVHYMSGVRVDYTIIPPSLLEEWRRPGCLPDNLDSGYRVLVDKDAITIGMDRPTFTTYVIDEPDRDSYLAVIKEFFWESTYVAKNLCRNELLPLKYSLETVMKADLLRRMLEWRIGLESGWTIQSGVVGKGLKRKLSLEVWSEFKATFVTAEIEQNWEALFSTIRLFSATAILVAEALGFTYPDLLDKRVMQYIRRLRVELSCSTNHSDVCYPLDLKL